MPELCVDTRTVGGAFSVDECARRIIHYKFAEQVCMTTEAGWAPTTPSIKAKFAFGEHCYQDSIHDFWLGQRLPELRWYRYEPVNDDMASAGATLAFGRVVAAMPRWAEADVVLSLAADPAFSLLRTN